MVRAIRKARKYTSVEMSVSLPYRPMSLIWQSNRVGHKCDIIFVSVCTCACDMVKKGVYVCTVVIRVCMLVIQVCMCKC